VQIEKYSGPDWYARDAKRLGSSPLGKNVTAKACNAFNINHLETINFNKLQ
jgi:hypothetical protein